MRRLRRAFSEGRERWRSRTAVRAFASDAWPARRARPRRAIAAAAALGAAWTGLLLASQGEGIDGVATALPADDLAVVARGEIVYAERCASCHGVELEGQPEWRRRDANGLLPAPPHDAEGHTWHHADDLLFELVKYGPAAVIGDATYRSAMPAYEGVLPDADIVAALAYIKHSWPPEERRWQAEVDRTARGLEASGTGESALERLFR